MLVSKAVRIALKCASGLTRPMNFRINGMVTAKWKSSAARTVTKYLLSTRNMPPPDL